MWGDIWDEDVGLTGTKREFVMGGAQLSGNAEKKNVINSF